MAGVMRSRSRKWRRCIHGHNVHKQALRLGSIQKAVELYASANAGKDDANVDMEDGNVTHKDRSA